MGLAETAVVKGFPKPNWGWEGSGDEAFEILNANGVEAVGVLVTPPLIKPAKFRPCCFEAKGDCWFGSCLGGWANRFAKFELGGGVDCCCEVMVIIGLLFVCACWLLEGEKAEVVCDCSVTGLAISWGFGWLWGCDWEAFAIANGENCCCCCWAPTGLGWMIGAFFNV